MPGGAEHVAVHAGKKQPWAKPNSLLDAIETDLVHCFSVC